MLGRRRRDAVGDGQDRDACDRRLPGNAPHRVIILGEGKEDDKVPFAEMLQAVLRFGQIGQIDEGRVEIQKPEPCFQKFS